MNPGDLLLHLEAYLALENALGFSLRARERLLRDFVAFVEANNTTGTISSQIALDWACSVSARCGVSGRAARLSVARRFLFHLSAMVSPVSKCPVRRCWLDRSDQSRFSSPPRRSAVY
jgi:hypothetical protein